MIIRLGGRGWDCNQFLVKDPSSNAFDMVDAGHGLEFEQVASDVAKVTDLQRIRSVVVTHEHFDHVGGLPRWQELGAKVLASAPTAEKLRLGHDPTSAAFGAEIPTLEVDEVLEDGGTVLLGGQEHACIAAPGHCPGAMCYWHPDSGTLYAGDVLFADGGIGRFDFPDSDAATHRASIARLVDLPVQTLHCGHGPSVEGSAVARSLEGSLRHVQAVT